MLFFQMEKRYVFIFLAILCMAIISAQDSESEESFNNSTKIFCGQILTKQLSLVCKGKYNTLKGI